MVDLALAGRPRPAADVHRVIVKRPAGIEPAAKDRSSARQTNLLRNVIRLVVYRACRGIVPPAGGR